MVAAATGASPPAHNLSPTRDDASSKPMLFPHGTATAPHLAQKWIEQTRSLLDKEGHGPALDNKWAGHTLSQYPVVRVDDYSRLSDDRRIQTEIKNKQNVSAVPCLLRGKHQMLLGASPARAPDRAGLCSASRGHLRPDLLRQVPVGFRTYDERGCEFYWLMSAPLYGQADAGAIWNRTVSKAYTDPEPEGLGFDRCPYDPCIYSKCVDGDDEQRVTTTLYVDDGRAFTYAPFAPARAQAKRDWKTLSDKFLVKFGEPQPKDDYFLGADRAYHGTKVVEVSAATYIGSLTKRYLKDGSADSYPSAWTHTPASEELQKLYDAAIATRPTPEPAFQKRYASLYGSLLHAVKYRPEIAAAMGLCGTCAAICTEGLYKCLTRILVYLARSPRMGITYSAHAEAADELCPTGRRRDRPPASSSG